MERLWQGRAVSLGAGYRKLFSASFVSNLGDGMGLVAYPWLPSAVTRNPLLISGVAGRCLAVTLVGNAVIAGLMAMPIGSAIGGLVVVIVGHVAPHSTALRATWVVSSLVYVLLFVFGTKRLTTAKIERARHSVGAVSGGG